MSKLVQGTFKGIKTFTIINPTTYNNDNNWGVTICYEGELESLGFDENEAAEITALNFFVFAISLVIAFLIFVLYAFSLA